MATSPQYKVYAAGEYVASCKHIEDAAAIVTLRGDGSEIRLGHNGPVLWREGREAFPAGESYDRLAEVAWKREVRHTARPQFHVGQRVEFNSLRGRIEGVVTGIEGTNLLVDAGEQGQQDASEINRAIESGRQIVIQTGFGPHRVTGVNGNYDIWCRPFDPSTGRDTGDRRWFMGCRDSQWQDMVDTARERDHVTVQP